MVKYGTFIGTLGRNDADITERLSGSPILEYTPETRDAKKNQEDETEIIDPQKTDQAQKYIAQ